MKSQSPDLIGQRLNGVVIVLKDGFGFIKCPATKENVYFMRPEGSDIQINDNVVFTCDQGPRGHIATDLEFSRSRDRGMGARGATSPRREDLKTELGIVETVRLDQGYGFIQAVDREKNVYFRLNDVDGKIFDGMEVKFVVSQAKSQKMRAMNIQPLPKGTVKMEICLKKAATGIIVAQPRMVPHEEPGLMRLDQPVIIDEVCNENNISSFRFDKKLASKNGDTLERIELWPRCLPEGAVLKEGDQVIADVHHYRPDALIFGRKLKTTTYRKLGREVGTIKSIRLESGFGFIKPAKRDLDIFFRLSDVEGDSAALQHDMVLSYDLTTEQLSRSNGNSRFRAVRLRVERMDDVASGQSGLIAEGFKGRVNKTWKNGTNQLRMDGSFCCPLREAVQKSPLTPEELATLISNAEKSSALVGDGSVGDVRSALITFRDIPEWREAYVEYLSRSQVLEYQQILTDKFPGIVYSTLKSSYVIEGATWTGTLKIWKTSDEEYAQWKAANVTPSSEGAVNEGKPKKPDMRWMSSLPFSRGNTDESRGHVNQNAEVEFDLYLDENSGKCVAKNVRLALESIAPVGDGYEDPVTGINSGVIDIVKAGTKYGFIRRIPDDQKFFWHITDFEGINNAHDIQEGMCVLFMLGRKGGARCAINIKILSYGAPTQYLPLGDKPWTEQVLEGHCRAVAVSTDEVVIVDSSGCPGLSKSLANLPAAIVEFEARSTAKENHDWKKEALGETTPPPATEAIGNGEVPESSPDYPPHAPEQALHVSSDIKEEKDSDKGPRYFAPVNSLPLTCAEGDKFTEGEIVHCSVVAHWCVQRHPIKAIRVAKSGQVAKKLQGVITRGRIVMGGIEIAQIMVKPQPEGGRKSFYCDIRTLSNRTTQGKRGEVEFYGDEETGVAVGVENTAVEVGMTGDRTINFTRRPVNADLLQTQSLQGLSHKERTITAKRPPDESEVGFPSGWRMLPTASELPWGHLLDHLQ